MIKGIFLCLFTVCTVVFIQSLPAQNNIVSSEGTLKDKFSKKLGNLMFSVTTLKYGRMKNNSSKADTIRIFNSGSKPINLSVGKVPDHLKVNLKAPVIEPKMESWMTVSFDGVKKNDYGFVLDRFDIITNDSVLPRKNITVTATLEEAFNTMNGEDSLSAPRARWNETAFDFGSIRQGEKVNHDFVVHNDGKKDLLFHKAKTTCGCLKTTFSKMSVAGGDSCLVKVEFDSFGKEGKESRKLEVFLNDYQKPNVPIEIKGEVTR